jgi:amino acid adenylation domain-containing protein
MTDLTRAVVELRGAFDREAFSDAVFEDWRDLPEDAGDEQLERYLRADGRTALFQRDDERYDLVLTCSEAALEGRSLAAVLDDLLADPSVWANPGHADIVHGGDREPARVVRSRHASPLLNGALVEAVWALVLACRGGRDEVTFGVVRSGRSCAVRVRVPWAASMAAWLEAWAPEPDGAPVESAVACEERAAGDGWRIRDLRRDSGLPLALQALAGPELLLALAYDPLQFTQEAAASLLELVCTLLDGIAARPEAPLADLPLLSAQERQRVVVDWNATESRYPRDSCVHELVAARAARAPAALAVSAGGERLSYRQLDGRASSLAHRLRHLGAGPGARVGLCLERSADLIVAQLAVLKAGAAFVPLDPDAPLPRLDFMRRDAGIRILLTQRRLLGLLPTTDVRTICLDEPAGPVPPEPAPPARAATPGDAAYVIYTSGSTGQPKGVEVEHRSLTCRASWCGGADGMGSSDRVPQISNPSFDGSVWEIWTCLVAGASLHVPDEATRTSPARLATWLCDEGITVTFLPTALAELMLERPWPASSALRLVLVGGDRLHRVLQDGLPFELHNAYGPTEATIFSTAGAVRTGPEGDALPPIGRPLADTRAYVLDPWQRPLPVGLAGELYIGGDGVARGYAARPELTADRFVPDPFGGRAGARLYRSGDLVRYLPAGSLEFLGRLDHQVKVRGFRVELGEIEAALLSLPGVTAAVATTVQDGTAERGLVAHVVADTAPERLRAALAGLLPAWMVPSAIVPLDRLPLTPNGKVDRAALPPPPAEGRPYEAPRTPLETLIAGLWCEALGVARIGRDDDFFERGGHSVLAMQVMLRTAEATGLDVPLRVLFEAPTPAAFAERVAAVQDDEAAAIRPLDREWR